MSTPACQFRRVSVLRTGAAYVLLLAAYGVFGCGDESSPTESGGGGSSASGGAAGSGGTAGTMGGTGGADGGAAGSLATGGASAGMAGSTSGAAGSVDGAAGAGAAGGGSGGSGGARPSTGCGKMPPASNRYGIDVSGTMREYIVTVPENYDSNRPYRLVFGWHPRGGSAQMVAGQASGRGGYYGLQGQAAGSAIFVAPEGIDQGWANTGGRDIAFLRAMLDRFRAELCVDEDRIFSTGFSYGGMMSFAVGCAMGGVFRAIAPMAGALYSGCVDGSQPVAVMGFHGDDDNVVPIANGRQGRDVFIQRNQCTEQTTPVTPSWCDGLQQSNQPCSCVSYEGCAAGYPVIWCEFNGTHTPAPNSAAAIWAFFSQF